MVVSLRVLPGKKSAVSHLDAPVEEGLGVSLADQNSIARTPTVSSVGVAGHALLEAIAVGEADLDLDGVQPRSDSVSV